MLSKRSDETDLSIFLSAHMVYTLVSHSKPPQNVRDFPSNCCCLGCLCTTDSILALMLLLTIIRQTAHNNLCPVRRAAHYTDVNRSKLRILKKKKENKNKNKPSRANRSAAVCKNIKVSTSLSLSCSQGLV